MSRNTAWHKANVIPRNASLDYRIRWHLAHQKYCGCRPIPKRLLVEINKRKKSPLIPQMSFPLYRIAQHTSPPSRLHR